MTTARDLADLWDETSRAALALVEELSEDDLSLPTELPGWSVGDVVAHIAHLESVSAGMPQPEGGSLTLPTEDGAQPITISDVVEPGVATRRGWTREELLDELRAACDARRDLLADADVDDPGIAAPGAFAVLGWPLKTVLTNRSFDLWVHEQDIRRATGRPIETKSAGAAHAAAIFERAFPVALRRLPAGTSVVLDVTGPQGRVLAAEVGDDGRATPIEAPAEPSLRLGMDDATWLMLGAGRPDPTEVDVEVTGDAELAAQVLRQLAVTP